MDEAVGGNHTVVLALGLVARLAEKRIHQEQDLDVIGIAPQLDRMRAHIVAVLLHAADLIGCRDDRIGVLGGKGAAARRAAGLHKSRPALRRWPGIEGAAALEELALERDRVNLAPITKEAAFAF